MVIKRGNTWYVRIGTKNAAGKSIQKWISCPHIKTESEAKKEEIRLRSQQRSGHRVDTSKETVRDFLGRWLQGVKASVQVTTYETNERHVNNHLIPHLGNRRLSELNANDLRLFYSEMKESGRIDGKGGLSACSVGHLHRVLYQALQQAVNDGLLERNPVGLVKPPKPDDADVVILNEQQAHQLLAAAAGTVLYLPILLALFTGLRRGEILALRWEDIDLQRETVSVKWAAARVNAGTLIKRPKSKSSRRTIFLPPGATSVLRNYQRAEGLILCRPDGRPMAPDAFSHAFADLLRRNKLPKMRFHDLRHTHVSLLIKYGVEMKAISSRVGHSGIGVTMDVYGHLLTSVEQDAAQRFERGFQANCGAAAEPD